MKYKILFTCDLKSFMEIYNVYASKTTTLNIHVLLIITFKFCWSMLSKTYKIWFLKIVFPLQYAWTCFISCFVWDTLQKGQYQTNYVKMKFYIILHHRHLLFLYIYRNSIFLHKYADHYPQVNNSDLNLVGDGIHVALL